jgi:hypothetical protein
VLALFGLGPGFDPRGSVSITSGGGNLVSMNNLTATVGGGTVTIESTVIPEPSTLGLAGLGSSIVGLAVFSRHKLRI